jgi:hypothetical protein
MPSTRRAFLQQIFGSGRGLFLRGTPGRFVSECTTVADHYSADSCICRHTPHHCANRDKIGPTVSTHYAQLENLSW